MADKRARYVGGSQTGVDLPAVPLANGETVHVHVVQGGELPNEINGVRLAPGYRDSLLEQSDQWTEFNRATGEKPADDKAAATPAAKEG